MKALLLNIASTLVIGVIVGVIAFLMAIIAGQLGAIVKDSYLNSLSKRVVKV